MKAFAIDLGGTTIKYGLGDENGLITSSKIPTLAEEGGEALMLRLIELVKTQGEGAQAVGVSTAGQIDVEQGRVVFATQSLPGWTGMDIAGRIKAATGLPVAVENDVNAAALGEATFGSMKDCPTFLALMYGTGVGGAIVEQGHIYRGELGNAAEFGHMVTHAVDPKPCPCGGLGCYETYASTRELERQAVLRDLPADARDLFARQEEPAIAELLEWWLTEISAGLATLCYIFHPAHIMLGGGVMQQKGLCARIEKKLHARLMSSYAKVQLHSASLPQESGLLGALHIALTQAK